MIHQFDPLHSLKFTADVLGVSVPTLYRKLAARELTAIKIGRNTKIRQSEMERYIEAAPKLVSRCSLVVDESYAAV